MKVMPNQAQEMAVLYRDDWSSQEIADRYGICKNHVLRLLKNQGVMIRDASARTRVYPINAGAFDDIDNNPVARYFFGLMLADGAIFMGRGKPSGIIISLTQTDVKLLEDFRSFLESEHPIYTDMQRNNHCAGAKPMAVLHIGCIELAEKLIALGITPRKSQTAMVPERFAQDPSLWRGVCDGDGSVFFEMTGSYPNLSMCGSLAMMKQWQKFVESCYPWSRTRLFKQQNASCYVLKLHCCAAIVMLKALEYDGYGVALERKRKAALECLAWIPKAAKKQAKVEEAMAKLE